MPLDLSQQSKLSSLLSESEFCKDTGNFRMGSNLREAMTNIHYATLALVDVYSDDLAKAASELCWLWPCLYDYQAEALIQAEVRMRKEIQQ